MIRAESSFRVGYYAGRHSQPTPQLVERPSTSQLRLADAQRRRSRRSTPPPDGTERVSDGTKKFPAADGTEKASDGTRNLAGAEGTQKASNVTPKASDGTLKRFNGLVKASDGTQKASNGTVKASDGTVKASNGTQQDGSLPPQSPGKVAVQNRGSAGSLTDRVKSSANPPKGTALGNREKRSTSEGPSPMAEPSFGHPKRSDKKPETSGFCGGLTEAGGRAPSAPSKSGSRRGAKGLVGVTGDEMGPSGSDGGGASRNATQSAATEAQHKASARVESDPDTREERTGSGARASASTSGKRAPASALRGDKRPGPSAMKSPLGLVLRTESSVSPQGIDMENGAETLGSGSGENGGSDEPNAAASSENLIADSGGSGDAENRRWTLPDAAPRPRSDLGRVRAHEPGGLEVLDHLPEPSRRETPLGRAFSENLSRPRGNGGPAGRNGGFTGELVRGTDFLRTPEEDVTPSRANDVSGPHATWKDDATERTGEDVGSGDERGPRSQAGSPDGAPGSGGRRSRRRARWRVRARSALSSVEVSLETARRLREQELPRESYPRGSPGRNGTGRRGGLGEAEGNRGDTSRGASSVRWEEDETSGGEKRAAVGRSAAAALAAADAEVSRRIAPKVLEIVKSMKRVEEQQGRVGTVLSPATGEEAKAAKALRLAQVYGPRKPVRRRSSSSAAAAQANESAVPGIAQKPGGRAQSISVPKGQGSLNSPGSLSSQLRKRLHSLPLLHSPPGSPDHAWGTFEATGSFAGSPKEELSILPPVNYSDLPPVDLSDLPTPSEIVRMELGPEEKRSLDLVPLPLDALTLPWQAYTIPVASSNRWDGLQTEIKRKEKAKAAKLRRKTGLTEQQLKQSELQAVAHLRNHTVDLVGGRDLPVLS